MIVAGHNITPTPAPPPLNFKLGEQWWHGIVTTLCFHHISGNTHHSLLTTLYSTHSHTHTHYYSNQVAAKLFSFKANGTIISTYMYIHLTINLFHLQ